MNVSAIITTYNRDYVVAEAMMSVLAQTFTDFELLVVDDGSRDRTAEVVARFADSRVRYLPQRENRGVGAARNVGLREARGEFISFLDSDDVWKPRKLERDLDFLKRHGDAGGVFSDLQKIEPKRRIGSFMREWPCATSLLAKRGWQEEIVFTEREMYLYLLREVAVKLSSFTFRRGVLNELGRFKAEWSSGEDWEFFLRFAKKFRFGYIDDTLAIQRAQRDATHTVHAVADKSNILKMLGHEAVIAKDREARNAARAGCRDAARHLSWEYLAQGKRLEATGALTRAFAFTGDTGLLARAAFALLRPPFQDKNREAEA